MKRPRTFAPRALDRLEQVRILAHPLRLQLLELFAESPRTTKQAAERLGLPPTRLYHHVAALERVGLVRVKETRPNRGTIEKHFEAVARNFSFDPTDLIRGKGKAARTAAARLAGEGSAALAIGLVERAREELLASIEAVAAQEFAADDPRGPVALRAGLIGSPAEVAELKAELLALIQSWSKRKEAARGRKKGPDGGEIVRAWLTIVYAPEPGA